MAKANEERRQKYLTELGSGVHHAHLSDKPGKREQNRVFVDSALAAGYSESSAKNHRQKIDGEIGFDEVMKAYEEGRLMSLREEKSPNAVRVEATGQAILPVVPEFGNAEHIGIVNIAGKIGNKALRFLELSAEAVSKGIQPTDKELMLQAGFTPAQSRNPKRLRELLGKTGAAEIMDALAYLGVDSMMFAERIHHFMNRKKMIPVLVKDEEGKDEVMLDAAGNIVLQETEFYDQGCVDMAMKHIHAIRGSLPPGEGGRGEASEVLSEEDRRRLDRQMADRGLVAA